MLEVVEKIIIAIVITCFGSFENVSCSNACLAWAVGKHSATVSDVTVDVTRQVREWLVVWM